MIDIKVNLLIKSWLRNEKKEYNIKGIYNNNIIKYQDIDCKMIINMENKTIERMSNEYKIFLDFENNKGYINYDNYKVNIDFDILECIILKNKFQVKYQIENDLFELSVLIDE